MTKSATSTTAAAQPWERYLVIALATLILCGCQSLSVPQAERLSMLRASSPAAAQSQRNDLAEALLSQPQSPVGQQASHFPAAPPCPCHAPCPGGCQTPTKSVQRPEEYICDGGDYELPVRVKQDWSITGLEQEDTVAHYDTLDGRTVVQPSNRVCIYAPRFGAARRVDQPSTHQTHRRVNEYQQPTPVGQQDLSQLATSSVQRLQPLGEVGRRSASLYRSREQGGGVEGVAIASGVHDSFGPYEDLLIIREGRSQQSENARLAIYADAARVWSATDAVQVMIKNVVAVAAVVDRAAEVVYRLEHESNPQLRIVKVASTDTARPGETVEFTLRYDNIGNEAVGNVTIIDNLASRLEYVEESQRSTDRSDFSSTVNQGGSLALRWEIIEPIEPGQGGIIRFRCRVR